MIRAGGVTAFADDFHIKKIQEKITFLQRECSKVNGETAYFNAEKEAMMKLKTFFNAEKEAMMKLKTLLTGAVLAASGILAYAEQTHAAGANDGHGHGDTQIGEPGTAAETARSVEVALRDNYYEPESIAVKKGETIRFTVKNKGLLVHEFNIGTAAMHAAHKKEMLMMMQHGILLPNRIDREKMAAGGEGEHSMQHDDPNSVLLEPGEEGEIVWKFSAAATLEFACNIPGHYESGMVGEIQFQ